MRSTRRVLPSLRGVTLLEVMITVAILGIVAALAVPNLGPVMRRTALSGAAEEVAMFLEEARRLAYATGRCHRVVQTAPNRLEIHRRKYADCVTMDHERDGTIYPIESMKPYPIVDVDGWTATGRRLVPEEGIQFQLEVDANDTIAPDARDAIVFRPNSRLWGDGDLNTADEGARIVLHYANPPPIPDTREVRVTPVGRICIVRHSGAAPLFSELSVPTQCP